MSGSVPGAAELVTGLLAGRACRADRGAKGVKLINLAGGDKLLSVARIVDTREDDEVPAEHPAPERS